MPGVEILSSQPIYQTEYLWSIVLICTGLGFLLSLIAAIVSWTNLGFEWAELVVVLVTTLVTAFFGFLVTVSLPHETDTVDYIEYKCIIDDSVSLTEFNEKYEILDQEGKIYTVKER